MRIDLDLRNRPVFDMNDAIGHLRQGAVVRDNDDGFPCAAAGILQ